MKNKIEKPNSRRDFLKLSAAAGGGLIVAFYMPSGLNKVLAAEPAAKAKLVYPPNAFLKIAPDNTITFIVNKLEMGQGVNTSMAQLIAEELECDWKSIRSVSAPVNPVYNHTVFPMQMTGGSTALASSWDQHRKIGASMREMLKSAAAARWKVPVTEVKAENGFIVHSKKGKLSYGDLANEANQLPLPENPPLKESKNFKVIGKSVKRVDALEKSNGTAIFGMDVRIPNMLYAMVARPHIDGAKLVSINEKAARAVKGVVNVVKFPGGVAVLAKNTHAAKVGRDALDAKWKSAHSKLSTADIMGEFKKLADKKGIVAESKGSVEEPLKNAAKVITAGYEFPFLAHAPMEPMNCTVDYDGKKATLWSGHQMPGADQGVAAKILGLKPENVTVNTVYAGGSFGRRASKNSDYVVQACQIAKLVKKPLKVVWSREDDMHGGYYRPMNFHKVQIAFDSKNQMTAWKHHIVGHTVMGGSAFGDMMIKNGLEATVTEGVTESKYEFANFHCEQTRPPTPVTTLWWRSVGHTHTGYVMETMMDEVAEATKQDPFELRRNLLKKSPRHVATLDLLKKQTGWGKKKAPKGRAWGIALHESFGTVVGTMVEASMVDGKPLVHKVWSAVNCGQVVNPEGAKTQVEGAVVFALSAALHQEIEIKDGQIVQTNFDNYPVLRIQDMPVVDVAFVESTEPPTGLGEPGVPPVGPALANAIYQLTNKRVRVLPMSRGLA